MTCFILYSIQTLKQNILKWCPICLSIKVKVEDGYSCCYPGSSTCYSSDCVFVLDDYFETAKQCGMKR